MSVAISRCLSFFIIAETAGGCFFVSKEELDALKGPGEDGSGLSPVDSGDSGRGPPDDSGDTSTPQAGWGLDTGPPLATWELNAEATPRYYGVATGRNLTGEDWVDLALGEAYVGGGIYTDGRVSLYVGPIDTGGEVGAADLVLRSSDSAATVGWGLDVGEDMLGDGSAALIVNAPTWNGGEDVQNGAAFVMAAPLSSSDDEIEENCAICVVAENDQRLKAHPAASAGDVDGDGTEDLAMGWYWDPGTGYGVWDVYLFADLRSGTLTPEDATAYTSEWDSLQTYGNSEWLAGGGDVVGDSSGDAYDDLLVGVWVTGESPKGQIRLVEGAGTDLSALFDRYTIVAEGNGVGEEGLGFIRGLAGDAGDLVYYTDTESGLYVYDADQGATQLLSVDADAGQSAKMAGAGDVNGDGFADISVSVQVGDDETSNAVLAGPLLDRPTVSLDEADWTVSTPGDAGWVRLADLSGDGVTDLFIVQHAGTSAWLYAGEMGP